MAQTNLDKTVIVPENQLVESDIQAVHQAALDNRFDDLRDLVEANSALADARDKINQSPLLVASRRGHLAIVKYLLSKNANLHVATHAPEQLFHEYQAMHYVAERGHLEVLKCLIEHGALLDTPAGLHGSSLLHLAAKANRLEIARELLSKKPDLLDWVDKQGNTPLIYAAIYGALNVAALLLENGANMEMSTDAPGDKHHGKTALHYAAAVGNLEVLMCLIQKGANLNKRLDHLHIIHLAAMNNRINIIEFLLKDWPQLIEVVDNQRQTPLVFAVKGGHKELTSSLLQKGADLHIPGLAQPLLLSALENDDPEISQTLLEFGASLDDCYPDEKNHLICLAAKNGHLKMVDWILQKRPESLTSYDHFGKTALFWAASAGQTEVVRYLLDKGADLSGCSSSSAQNKYNALEAAMASGCYLTANLLLLKTFYPLHKATIIAYIKTREQVFDLMELEPELTPYLLEQAEVLALLKKPGVVMQSDVINHYKLRSRSASCLTTLNLRTGNVSFFKPVSELGKGSYGVVRLFKDQSGNQLAVKSLVEDAVIDPDKTFTQAEQAKLETVFNKTAYADKGLHLLFQIVSSNDDGCMIYNNRHIMPFFQGNTLWNEFPKVRSRNLMLKILYQIAIELRRMHTLGIIHGDLSPVNMIVDLSADEVSLRFIDFGFAYSLDDEFAPIRKPDNSAPNWFAPEMHVVPPNRIKPDQTQDLYQLGYFLEMAFNLNSFKNKFYESFPEIAAFVKKAQSPNPSDRPSLESFIAELEGAMVKPSVTLGF